MSAATVTLTCARCGRDVVVPSDEVEVESLIIEQAEQGRTRSMLCQSCGDAARPPSAREIRRGRRRIRRATGRRWWQRRHRQHEAADAGEGSER